MRFVLTYWTRTDNNKKVADYLADELGQKGEVQVFTTDLADPARMPEADVYIFSAPMEMFRIQVNMRKFIKALDGMEGKKSAIVNTHGMKKFHWLRSMGRMVRKKGMVKVAEVEIATSWGESVTMEDGWEQKLDAFCAQL